VVECVPDYLQALCEIYFEAPEPAYEASRLVRVRGWGGDGALGGGGRRIVDPTRR
jgi:hypothetical protein